MPSPTASPGAGLAETPWFASPGSPGFDGAPLQGLGGRREGLAEVQGLPAPTAAGQAPAASPLSPPIGKREARAGAWGPGPAPCDPPHRPDRSPGPRRPPTRAGGPHRRGLLCPLCRQVRVDPLLGCWGRGQAGEDVGPRCSVPAPPPPHPVRTQSRPSELRAGHTSHLRAAGAFSRCPCTHNPSFILSGRRVGVSERVRGEGSTAWVVSGPMCPGSRSAEGVSPFSLKTNKQTFLPEPWTGLGASQWVCSQGLAARGGWHGPGAVVPLPLAGGKRVLATLGGGGIAGPCGSHFPFEGSLPWLGSRLVLHVRRTASPPAVLRPPTSVRPSSAGRLPHPLPLLLSVCPSLRRSVSPLLPGPPRCSPTLTDFLCPSLPHPVSPVHTRCTLAGLSEPVLLSYWGTRARESLALKTSTPLPRPSQSPGP